MDVDVVVNRSRDEECSSDSVQQLGFESGNVSGDLLLALPYDPFPPLRTRAPDPPVYIDVVARHNKRNQLTIAAAKNGSVT